MTGMERLEEQLVEALRRHLADGTPVRLPEAGRLLWRAFVELDATRTMHMAGPNPIPYTEIFAYARLTGLPLQPHHVQILRAMDTVLLEHFAASRGAPDGAKPPPRESKAPLTPALFDAMMG